MLQTFFCEFGPALFPKMLLKIPASESLGFVPERLGFPEASVVTSLYIPENILQQADYVVRVEESLYNPLHALKKEKHTVLGQRCKLKQAEG